MHVALDDHGIRQFDLSRGEKLNRLHFDTILIATPTETKRAKLERSASRISVARFIEVNRARIAARIPNRIEHRAHEVEDVARGERGQLGLALVLRTVFWDQFLWVICLGWIQN